MYLIYTYYLSIYKCLSLSLSLSKTGKVNKMDRMMGQVRQSPALMVLLGLAEMNDVKT